MWLKKTMIQTVQHGTVLICEAIRRALMMLSHQYGENSTTEIIQSTHRAFINSNPNDLNFVLSSIPIDSFNGKNVLCCDEA
jgi:hypothetical protein